MSEVNSYHRILRSSSIIGGAQLIRYAIGLVQIKIVALLLGPAGVGLVGLYQSAMTTIGSATGLGIGSSGVREVAAAYVDDDPRRTAGVAVVLRRTCWITGATGWLVTIALAAPLSRWMTGTPDHAWAIALLGGTVLIATVSGGQMAIIQGTRRIGDIARASVWGALATTILAAGLYAWLGKQGIVPVLLGTAFITLWLSFHYARRIELPAVRMAWRETVKGVAPLLRLGSAFTLSALLTAGLDLFARGLISHQLGLDATGIYQAAWALSGTVAAFILQAMGTDFYPRLTAVIHNHAQARDEVNQQTEIGVLLAMPGLVAAIAFAPIVVWLLYSSQFAPAAMVLTWMVLGVFGRVVSWPMSYIMLALGAAKWFAATEFAFIGIWAALIFSLVSRYGVIGAGYAFAATYAIYTVGMLWAGHALIGFRWSRAVRQVLALSAAVIVTSMASSLLLPAPWHWLAGVTLLVATSVISARGLTHRLGPRHLISRVLTRIPYHRWIIGL